MEFYFNNLNYRLNFYRTFLSTINNRKSNIINVINIRNINRNISRKTNANIKTFYFLLVIIIGLFYSFSSAAKVKVNEKINNKKNTQVWALEKGRGNKNKPQLVSPLERLFSHPKHLSTMEKMNVYCMDCHRFSIKSEKKDTLPKKVEGKYLKSSRSVCHQCHLGKIAFPRQNNCSMCHKKVKKLAPKDHYLGWKNRHGKMSQFDRDSCNMCHTQKQCASCHIKRDINDRKVHSGNYRRFHSVEARMKPASCVTCHRTIKFCIDCHANKRKR